jgi:hypothetical protein
MVSADEDPKYPTKMIQIDPANDIEGYLPVNIIDIDPSIKSATPYYYFLTLNEEGRQNCLKSLDTKIISIENENTHLSEDILALKEGLMEIWSAYPVVSETKKGDDGYPTYGGTITSLKFSSGFNSNMLSMEENAVLEKIQSFQKDSNDNITGRVGTPKWIGNPSHQQISYWAAYKTSFPNPSTVSSTADDPDLWYDNSPEPFKTIFHGLNHYYSPLGIGGAPQNTADYVAIAENEYDQGSTHYVQAATNLGYASHFLEDVGNPMHTGREWDQYNNPWVHSKYETYVGNRWYSGFEYVVSGNNNYIYTTDWVQGTKDLAGYSNGYLDTLYTQVYNKGSSWDLSQDSTIDAITNNVVLLTEKYTNGLAYYARLY